MSTHPGASPAVLMLSTIHGSHARHSGYGRLAEYVPGAKFIHAPRADPRGGLKLFLARVARRLAFSRWYLGGSASLEWQALAHLRGGFRGVVHSLWADHDFGFLDLVLRRPRHRLFGTFHNCPDDFQHTIRFPRRLHNFERIILMSECQRPFFRAAGVPDEKIHVVLHGVDTAHFTPSPANEERPFTVLSAGGFRRNFPLLRQVCDLLAGEPGVRFEIVAPADFRAQFEALPNVSFSTGLTDDELLAKYQSASCLLHPAEQATANNVLLEALACGAPIIAERIGGIPEYTTSACSLLTAPGDAAALAEAIRRLSHDPALQRQMSAAARARAEELSWERVAERMGELYRS
jgi:glycosyltransferase involved in cell wall biosynthesis